jgi:hypothetical protein
MTELFGLPLTAAAQRQFSWRECSEIIKACSDQINYARICGLEPFWIHYHWVEHRWVVWSRP